MKTRINRETGARALTVVSWLLVVPAAVWALGALVVVALLRRWAAAVVAALAVTGLAVAVLPRAVGSPDEPVAGGQSISLVAFNLLRGKADLSQLLEIAHEREVDLLSLQEVTPEAAARMREPDFRKAFPYAVLKVDPVTAGGALLSRFPLAYVGSSETWAKQPRATVRAPGGVPFELMSVHPNAPAGPRTTPRWDSDFEVLPQAGEGGPPRVLAGDFNATLDHRNLRDLIDSGYRDSGDVTGSGLLSTWPSKLKWPLPVTIDHILVETPIAITGYDVLRIGGSDHRAVLTELSVPPG